MSNYVKATNFATKDTLPTGDSNKIVKGTEIDNEFNSIAGAISSKADIASPTFTGTPAGPTATAGSNTTQLATTAFVTAGLQSLYPVGSIYINASSSTNPSSLIGFGTWVSFGAGRVLVGFDSSNSLFNTAEETGGSADAIVVSHTHAFTGSSSSSLGTHTHTFSGTTSGQSNTHSHTATSTVTDPGHRHDNAVPVNDPAANSFGVTNNVRSQELTAVGDSASTWWTSTATTGITVSTSIGNASADHSHTYSGTTSGQDLAHTHTITGTNASTGSSGTNANYQPYITVYMWKRTA